MYCSNNNIYYNRKTWNDNTISVCISQISWFIHSKSYISGYGITWTYATLFDDRMTRDISDVDRFDDWYRFILDSGFSLLSLQKSFDSKLFCTANRYVDWVCDELFGRSRRKTRRKKCNCIYYYDLLLYTMDQYCLTIRRYDRTCCACMAWLLQTCLIRYYVQCCTCTDVSRMIDCVWILYQMTQTHPTLYTI